MKIAHASSHLPARYHSPTEPTRFRTTIQCVHHHDAPGVPRGSRLAGLGSAGAPLTTRANEQEAAGREFGSARLEAEKDAQALEDKLTGFNFRDDQFDLAEAAIAIAIARLAVVALTGQRWLFWGSLIPAAFGLFMGLAGTFQWPILPRFLTHLVS